MFPSECLTKLTYVIFIVCETIDTIDKYLKRDFESAVFRHCLQTIHDPFHNFHCI